MTSEKITEITKDAPSFVQLTDLGAERLGGKVLYATDDFFADKENLLKPGRGVFIEDRYTDRGKWMDGWESRRKRTPGHDWAVIQLATAGKITGFDIDTNFFLGNHPPHASIEAVYMDDVDPVTEWKNIAWQEILPTSSLDAGSRNFYESHSDVIFTHIRLHIYPDGGVARFRIYGEVFRDWDSVRSDEEIDLVAAIHGGKAIACNDMFFSAMGNLIMPGRGVNMGDGWETKRNRTPGNRDWVILKLATPGIIERILVDTVHFKGNYPDTCSIEACMATRDEDVPGEKTMWHTVLPPQKLNPDSVHEYTGEIAGKTICSHARLNIFPDGGISRIRLFGRKMAQ